MFGILSPVSELEWARHSLGVLSSPMLMSLSVGFTEKNKRVVSNFSAQYLQLKQQRKKIKSFLLFPNLHVSQLKSSQPSELALLILMEVTGNTILLKRFTGSSWSKDCQHRTALCGQSEIFHSSLNAHRNAAHAMGKVWQGQCTIHGMPSSSNERVTQKWPSCLVTLLELHHTGLSSSLQYWLTTSSCSKRRTMNSGVSTSLSTESLFSLSVHPFIHYPPTLPPLNLKNNGYN